MQNENRIIQDQSGVDFDLIRKLDRGLDDIDAGRTLSHKEAMSEVRRIREVHRYARSNTRVVVNE